MQPHAILSIQANSCTELSHLLQRWLNGSAIQATQSGQHRLAILGKDCGALRTTALQALSVLKGDKKADGKQIFLGQSEPDVQRIGWLFSGQGSQYLGMILPLLKVWPAFAKIFHRLEQDWSSKIGASIGDWLAGAPTPENERHLNDTRQAQIALGLVDIALARALQATGLPAHFLAGHSYGELPALACGGAFDDNMLFSLSRTRGKLLGEAGDLVPGKMLAAKCDRNRIASLLKPLHQKVFVANYNSQTQTVLAGTEDGILAACELLKTTGIAGIPLKTSCAFHSPFMAPIRERWQTFLASQRFNPIEANRVYANVTAAPYSGTPQQITDYLAQQITAPVLWLDEMEALYAADCRVFLEVGPGHVLSDLAAKILGERPHIRLRCDPEGQEPGLHLAQLFARLFCLGYPLDLSDFKPETPELVVQSTSQAATIMNEELIMPSNALIDASFFSANQQAVQSFYQQQQQIVGALDGQADPGLFNEMVRANQTVMQDFLATQMAAMQGRASVASIAAMPTQAASLPAPVVPTEINTSAQVQDAGTDSESWIIDKLAELTGLPRTRLHPQMKFESDLGIDSITLIELWTQLSQRYPALGTGTDRIGSISCIADIDALLHTMEKSAATPPQDEHPAQPIGQQLESWLLNELSMLTGLPRDRLNRDTQFESELGIDSITRIELWLKLAEAFPPLQSQSDGASHVQCVADVLRLIGDKDTETAATEKIAEHPAHDWLTRIRSSILQRIAEERGIDPASITGQSHFANDLGLDIFTRERIFEEEIGRNPKLAFAGRELLNVSNLDELLHLLSRFNNLITDQPLPIRNDEPAVASEVEAEQIERYVLVGQPPVPASELGSIPQRILLIGEEGTLHDTFRDKFGSCGVEIETLYLGVDCWRHPASKKIVAIDHIEGIREILSAIAPGGQLPAIIYLGISDLATRAAADNAAAWRDEIERGGVGLFALAKAASATMKAMGRDACFGVITSHDNPAWAAASGVAKSLAREWPKARIRTVRLLDHFEDLSPHMVLKVLTWGPSAHDLQLVKDGVIRQVLVKKPINQDVVAARHRQPRLGNNSAILLVGGASGITAEAGVMLAQQYHARIVAIGRTPMPETYPYQGIADDAHLKRILLDELRSNGMLADDAHINQQLARIRRQREIWNTRQRVERIGGRFSYYEADVTDAHSISAAIERIHAECGQVHGLIHGAGVIDDCLIEKKSVEEFKDVYYTKAISVFNLWHALKDDPLQFAFLFSSLASYTGTPGQTDYVAANEVINEMAKFWNSRVPYRVRSLLWSVWTEAGLASPESGSAIQRQMARLGLGGISNRQGVKLLHDEIIAGDKFDEWVLLSPRSTLEYTARGSAATSQPQRPQLSIGRR